MTGASFLRCLLRFLLMFFACAHVLCRAIASDCSAYQFKLLPFLPFFARTPLQLLFTPQLPHGLFLLHVHVPIQRSAYLRENAGTETDASAEMPRERARRKQKIQNCHPLGLIEGIF